MTCWWLQQAIRPHLKSNFFCKSKLLAWLFYVWLHFPYALNQLHSPQHRRGESSGKGLTDSSSLLNWHQSCKRYSSDDLTLPEPQCQCTETSIICVNAQLKSQRALKLLDFPNLHHLTLHGNTLGTLPERTATTFSQLRTLNLSANYLMTLHPKAFQGLINVERLDLSVNEINLDDTMKELFSPLHKLKELNLKRAFSSPSRSAMIRQMERLENIFRHSKLYQLERLDLSMNSLIVVRPRLFCPVDKLTHLFLARNHLKRLELDLNCLRNLKVLDLSENKMVALDSAFFPLMDQLPINAVRLYGNPFECYCNSSSYILKLNTTNKVMDKFNLTCDRASPSKYLRRELLKVPLEKLDCPKVAANNAIGRRGYSCGETVRFVILCLVLLLGRSCID